MRKKCCTNTVEGLYVLCGVESDLATAKIVANLLLFLHIFHLLLLVRATATYQRLVFHACHCVSSTTVYKTTNCEWQLCRMQLQAPNRKGVDMSASNHKSTYNNKNNNKCTKCKLHYFYVFVFKLVYSAARLHLINSINHRVHRLQLLCNPRWQFVIECFECCALICGK